MKLLRFIILAVIVFAALTPLTFINAQDAAPAVVSRWDGERRFTVLVMGMDRRPGARDTLRVRTDAIMLVSFDPQNDSIGVMHIPRDLHFAAPDIKPLVRVNTLVLRGEELQEGYGPYYMMDVLQYNLGLYIDAYILFDFEAFITVVDALGGVEVTTDYIIDDPTYPDMNYGYDPFYLPSGTHTLDGRTALKFARTRHGDNDYNRGFRQMQLVKALGLKATDPGVLTGLIARAPQWMADLQDKIYTDLTLDEMIQLGVFGARVPVEKVVTGSISQQYVDRLTISGVNIDTPDRTKLSELMTTVFGEGYNQ